MPPVFTVRFAHRCALQLRAAVKSGGIVVNSQIGPNIMLALNKFMAPGTPEGFDSTFFLVCSSLFVHTSMEGKEPSTKI